MEKELTYQEFIQDIINKRGQWGISKNEYYEMHHIIAICQGGEGDAINKDGKSYFHKNSHHPNCIYLYPDEHFIAHYLLVKENPDSIPLNFALHCMISLGLNHIDINKHPKEYAEARLMAKEAISKSQLGNTATKYRKWYNNGVQNKMFYVGDQPEDWVLGRLPFSHQALINMHNARLGNTATKGHHWYNNGVINVSCKSCPEGFVPGQLKNYKNNLD